MLVSVFRSGGSPVPREFFGRVCLKTGETSLFRFVFIFLRENLVWLNTIWVRNGRCSSSWNSSSKFGEYRVKRVDVLLLLVEI